MATLGTSKNTLHDIVSRLDGDKKSIADIIEVLARATPFSEDLQFYESNEMTGNIITQRTSLPTIGTRKLNRGVASVKSSTKQRRDTLALYEAASDVDYEMLRINNFDAAFRKSEDDAIVSAFGQTLETDFIYADTASDETKFNGLACRYDTPSSTRGNAGYYMLSGGGSGSDNTSIWMVAHGKKAVHAIYPMGLPAGLEIDDIGKTQVADPDDSTKSLTVYRTRFMWRCGLSVADVGAVVRICNIDVSALTSDSSNADLIELMEKAGFLMEERCKMGNPVTFYCNKTVASALARQARTATNMNLTWGKDMFGGPVMNFQGTPIRVSDKLLNTEATISGTFQSDI